MNTNSSSVQEVLRQRRSIRRYLSKPVPEDTLMEIISSANWAPSAHNRQPWRFVIIDNPENRGNLADAMGAQLRSDLSADGIPTEKIDEDCARSKNRIVSAPALLLLCLSMADMDVYPDEQRAQAEYLMAVQSVAMAGQNLMLAAHEAGLASCWLCAPLFCTKIVQECLNLPSDWQAQGLITLGYATVERNKTRRPVSEMILWR